MQLLKQDMRINYHKKPALIRTVDKEFIILEIENANSKVVSIKEYYEESKNGLITTYEPSLALVKPSRALTCIQTAQLKKYKDYISPLLEEGSPCSKRVRMRVINEVSRKRGDTGKNIPGASTLYAWYTNFVSDKVNKIYLNLVVPSNVQRGRHISTEIFDLFSSVVDECYLKPVSEGALNKEQTFRKLEIAFSKYKRELPSLDREKAKLFSRTVFYELIGEISEFEVIQEREGYSAALQRFRYTKSIYMAERPLERVQIDAVHINISLRDADGNYIGMPVVFLQFVSSLAPSSAMSYLLLKKEEKIYKALSIPSKTRYCQNQNPNIRKTAGRFSAELNPYSLIPVFSPPKPLKIFLKTCR
jgi:putative transposase